MNKLLELLHLRKQVPSLEYLKEIVQAHHFHVPYENVSKIVLFEKGIVFPTIEQYLSGIQEFGFGGTCFVRNLYLSDLLESLGFQIQLLTLESNGVPDSHCNILVNGTHLVDLGLMSGFVGPFELFCPELTSTSGLRTLKFSSNKDSKSVRIEIYRGNKLHRYFSGTIDPKTKSFFNEPIRKTYEPDALFMNTIRIFRKFDNREITLWDRDLYVLGEDGKTIRRTLESLQDLKNAVAIDLGLPRYPIEEIVRILSRNAGKDIFS